jgi:hypothetical protein
MYIYFNQFSFVASVSGSRSLWLRSINSSGKMWQFRRRRSPKRISEAAQCGNRKRKEGIRRSLYVLFDLLVYVIHVAMVR